MNEQELRVRSQLIPLQDLRLVLPNTAIAEVISYHKPAVVEDAPEWLSGYISWRGLRIPLINFETAAINQGPDVHRRNRVIVLNALSGSDSLPFYGILSQGIPRLIHLDSSTILDAPNAENHLQFVLRQVLVEGHPALIPDQKTLEASMAELGIHVSHDEHALAI
jgi:chemosensory pili system protein ChpC